MAGPIVARLRRLAQVPCCRDGRMSLERRIDLWHEGEFWRANPLRA